MPRFFFPDNTVLINFTHIGRHDLLEWFLRGNGAWTISTARECHNSSRARGLEQMSRWYELLPQPLAPEPAELVDAKAIAHQMRNPETLIPPRTWVRRRPLPSSLDAVSRLSS